MLGIVANGVAMDPTLRFLLTTLAGGVVACIFGILIIVLLVKPSGLMGEPETETV